ncbi:hypothetical protein GCM10011416_19410 [Polaribacter pacificus]|uniref:Uncharacterized protein n=1 Tax=Polaribacter pacificus TaxID=1775173 RepID=A0A917I1B7_9FLAO|nr:hypothetical protein GCM10011416_19410 [Polaribacter pacificus]
MFSFTVTAQIENTKGKTKTVKIPLTIKPTKVDSKPELLTFNSDEGFKNAKKIADKKKSLSDIERELKYKGIISNETLAEERMAKAFKIINGRFKRVDQDLGSFRSDSKYVRIICRDHQYPDGDRVTIYINGIPAIYNIVLEQNYQEFKIPLVKGVNKIGIKALNQGTSGPNTAAFKVYDDAGSLISANEWNLATGAVATLLIVKE